ncbi:MAG: IS66 family insertion sequence element accessory protein TnpA [Betaproteobacteria bacterium]
MDSKAAFWRRHLAAWRDSGQSQAAYCRQQDVSLPCFGYWRGKLGAVPSAKALLPIVVSQVSTPMDRMAVDLPNGLQVHLPVGSDAAQWVPMIRALMAC